MTAPGVRVEAEAPAAVGRSDQLALLRLARAAVANHLGLPTSGPIPPVSSPLLQRTDPVFVSFWVDGRLRGCHGADGRALHQNILQATLKTLEDGRVEPLDRHDLDRLRIEIDILGAPVPFDAHTVDDFEDAIEPGVHGVIARDAARSTLFRSSVAITRNWRVEELMRRLCEEGGWAPDAHLRGDLEFSRFRSIAFIESTGGERAQELLRANRPIGPADWSPERIATVIGRGADYLFRAQRSDGGFVYDYDPATGTSSSDDHIVRQLATMWIVAQLGRRDGSPRSREVLARSLPYICARMRPASRDSSRVVVSDDAGVALLGSSAFALLALIATEDDGFKEAARQLADGILSLQRPDGAFDTEFPAATRPEAEDFFPGEAMLALMQLHARYPDPRYLEALRHALPYYRAHFRARRSAAFVPWQIAAYAHLFRFTADPEYSSFVFELADAVVPRQHVGAGVPYPDYVGGYEARRAPGVSSATQNEGVLEASDVARRAGDRDRAARYQRAGLLAALFTFRLQFTDENAYYIERAENVLGAFRASLTDSTLRIDHSQHALSSLLKAERYLFRDAADSRATGTEASSRRRSLLDGVVA